MAIPPQAERRNGCKAPYIPEAEPGFKTVANAVPENELPPLSLSALFPTEDVEEAAISPKAGEKAGVSFACVRSFSFWERD